MQTGETTPGRKVHPDPVGTLPAGHPDDEQRMRAGIRLLDNLHTCYDRQKRDNPWGETNTVKHQITEESAGRMLPGENRQGRHDEDF